jgi:hypothetical protein
MAGLWARVASVTIAPIAAPAIGGLCISGDAMNNPGVGLEIAAGRREQACDQQRLMGKMMPRRLAAQTDRCPW